MTIQRPELTPAELQDARDAWTLVQLGQPVPTQYRPAAMRAAAYCFARGYDHDDTAEARPVFLHPDGGREGHQGVYGVNRTWGPTQLAAWVARKAGGMRAKGTGPMFSPGHSRVADEAPGEDPPPLPPLQRGDERCREIGWLFLDADDVGEWTPVLNAIGVHGGAYVRGRSGSHCPPGRSCELHPAGQIKWHLAVPLREPWAPSGNLNRDRAEWKGELYAAARFAFHLVAEVTGRGFDRQLDQFLCRMYVGAPYDPKHFGVPREVHGAEGLGFDVRACWAGLEDLGVVDPAQVQASRVAATLPPGVAWDEADGEPPMVAAFKVAGLYVRPMASGKHAVACPWQDTHTSGSPGDTSTILFPNGKFVCSHSHREGKAAGGSGMREVLAMLPQAAQDAHASARERARGRERSTPARRETRVSNDEPSEGGTVGGELAGAPPPAAAGDELAMLLTALEGNPDGALAEPFIRRVVALPAADLAKVHAKVKALKVPARPYNAAVSKAEKALQLEEERAANEARIATLAKFKPKIVLGPDEDRVTDEAVQALGQHPDVYQRAGALVSVRRDLSPAAGITRPKNAPRIVMLPVPTLRDYLSAAAVWVHVDPQEGPRRVHVPQAAVLAVHARGEWRGVRTLEAVAECPMLRPDGTVLEKPGFDPMTGLLYMPAEAFPRVPPQPTRDQVDAALALLFDAVADFPFKSRVHRAAWLGSVLTPFARPAFLGCSPLNLIDANVAGAGKGKLLNVIAMIVSGREFATMAPVDDDDEQRKRITSLALSGEPMVLIDNVAGTLGGPSLDSALTSTSWGDRLLGGNQQVRLPLIVTWFANGNNVQLTGDMQRRVAHIRLESPLDHPEDRKGFRHADLEAYVRENRPALVVAALTILRGFCAAGRPRQGLPPWGSFEGWSALVREAIVWAGEPDPGLTRAEVRAEADIASQALRQLVEGWPALARRYGGKCSAVKALQELARNEAAANHANSGETLMYEGLREALAELIQTHPGKLPTPRQLGNTLRRFKGRAVMCSDTKLRTLVMPKDVTKEGALWAVRTVDEVTAEGESGELFPARRGAPAGDSRPGEGESGDSDESVRNPPTYGRVTFEGANYTSHEGRRGAGDSPEPPDSPAGGEDDGPQWREVEDL